MHSPTSLAMQFADPDFRKRTFQGTISCVIDPLNNIGGIFLSGLEVAYNIKLLNDNNIKGVLSICGEAQIQYDPRCGIKHMIIPISDKQDAEITSHFAKAHDFITEVRQTGNILLHCIVGVSRSAAFLISYLMKKWGMLLEDALKHLIRVRPIVNPNRGFIEQLLNYERALFSEIYSELTAELSYHYYVQLNSQFAPSAKKRLGRIGYPSFHSPAAQATKQEIKQMTSPQQERKSFQEYFPNNSKFNSLQHKNKMVQYQPVSPFNI